MISTRALIISGGTVDTGFSVSDEYDLIIVVDGGLYAAKQMGILPQVILGDFDTVESGLLESYAENPGIRILRLNPEKDDTDTEAAIHFAMEQGITEIDLLGGTGTRMDHTMANFFMLKMAYEQGVRVCMYTGLSKIYMIHGKKTYRKSEFYGKYISFLPFDGSANGVTMKGFKYEVTEFDFDTRKTYRLGVSNEPWEEQASIEIKEGYMLAVESLEDKG